MNKAKENKQPYIFIEDVRKEHELIFTLDGEEFEY